MPIKYQNVKAGAPANVLEDSLHYDEIAISRFGEKVTLQFMKDGKELFSQPVWLTADGEVFRISGLKGSVKVEISST